MLYIYTLFCEFECRCWIFSGPFLANVMACLIQVEFMMLCGRLLAVILVFENGITQHLMFNHHFLC